MHVHPNGSNYLPYAHKAAGVQMASQVQCLDANGNPDAANGKIVWLSIGMSNTTQESQQFIPIANAYTNKNPKLTLVDGAIGGMTATYISSPGYVLHSAIFQIVANNFLEVLLRSYWHVAVFVILTKSNKSEIFCLIFSQQIPRLLHGFCEQIITLNIKFLIWLKSGHKPTRLFSHHSVMVI